jgi:hypothetical protein
MKINELQGFALAALAIGVGIWTWQAIVTPLMNRLGITSALQGLSS